MIISRNAEKDHKIKNLFKKKLLANSQQMVNFLKPDTEYHQKQRTTFYLVGYIKSVYLNIRDAAITFPIKNQTEVLAQKVWEDEREKSIRLKDIKLSLFPDKIDRTVFTESSLNPIVRVNII